METTTVSAEQYFEERMHSLGVTEENNFIEILQTDIKNPLNTIKVKQQIFRKHEKGIEIFVYEIDRTACRYVPDGARWKKNWSIVRLAVPVIDANGKEKKYHIPTGQGTFPFFPPSLVDKYENSTPIETLFLTEGYFKAFKGHLCGFDIVGVPSITHLKEKGTGALHQGIRKLIERCQVRKLVWLTDGDCLDIPKDLEDKDGKPKDLSTRPFGFYNSITVFHQLTDQYKDVSKFFMHINSEAIEGKPKGLDDLLCMHPGKVEEIKNDLTNVSFTGIYAEKFNITNGMGRVYNHFHWGSVEEFYLFHTERRPELKDKTFKFRGTLYKWNPETTKCEIVVPGEAYQYFRVGDTYYKYIHIPNQYGQLEKVFHERKKGTLIDDHGREFLKHVPKYEAFCNYPSHDNFLQTLHNCFNVYCPLDYKPDDEDCDETNCQTIIDFLKHIFGGNKVKATVDGVDIETTTFEMGLDYFQILYKKPQEKLPILCLVSKENNTGKSTLANLLRVMFGGNVAIVGNQDLAEQFNSHWSTKLVVVCDETKIEKGIVVEKVKALSTARKIMMNAKGKNQVEIDCFIKFVLISNNEENFIYANDDDIRYWILKVPKLKKENPLIIDSFIEEMPAFLNYLNRRKLTTSKMGRMWFYPELIKTDALKKVIAFSQPTVAKEITSILREMFIDFGVDEILMTRKAIQREFFNNRHEASYIEKILKDFLKVEPYHELDYKQLDANGQPTKVPKTRRHSYPKWVERIIDGNVETVRHDVYDNGRPYVFKREQFLTPEEISLRAVSNETQLINGSSQVPVVAMEFIQPNIPF